MQKQHAQNWVVAVVLGVLGTIQYHLAQFTSRFDTVFGDRGDVRGVVYFCEHWYQWLLGKADLMSPGIFYPTKHTLAYSDFLIGYAIPYSMARLFGFGMFSSIEIVVILLTFLSYVACYLLLKHVLNFKLLPACAGAMFFAFSSAKFHQLPHAQLQYVVLLPLIFACLILFVRKSQTLSHREAAAWLTAAAILWLLQATTAFYYAWFLVLWTLLFAFFALLLTPSRRLVFALARQYWRAILASAVVLLFGFGLLVLAYLPGLRGGQWYHYDFVIQMIPTWWSVLWMGDGNYLWGWLSTPIVPDPRPSTWNELRVGLGLVSTVAWLAVTIWTVWRLRAQKNEDPNLRLSAASRAFLNATVLATTLFFLIGFNYGNYSPWYFIYEYFPGGKAIRAVARYVIFLSLPMAVVFAFLLEQGLTWASEQKSKRTRKSLTAAIAFVAAFGVFEQLGAFKVGSTGFSKKAEEAYLKAMAAKLPADCTAFYIAPGNGTHSPAEYQYDGMMISSMTRIPTLNASSSQFPKGWDLYQVHDPNLEANVKKWTESQQIRGILCRLEMGPQVEAFDVRAPGSLDDPTFFVRQQYLDLAARQPNAADLAAYVTRLKNCKTNDESCSRENISLEVFRNSGFSEDGSFIFRLHQIAFARPPRYEEFNTDLAELRAARAKFVEDFTNRTEFVNRYAAMSDPDYLANLAQHAEGSLPDGASRLVAGKSRSQTLLAIAEDPEVTRRFANRAFVTLHYFGFLRRDPELNGYDGWVGLLNSARDPVRVTSGFVNSVEYRLRFFQSLPAQFDH